MAGTVKQNKMLEEQNLMHKKSNEISHILEHSSLNLNEPLSFTKKERIIDDMDNNGRICQIPADADSEFWLVHNTL
ncbi:11908_t:CDS:2 [Entrophospora sp. SA101]|nr:11908_t:CDS:2 [Entrophospora sp. SA101]